MLPYLFALILTLIVEIPVVLLLLYKRAPLRFALTAVIFGNLVSHPLIHLIAPHLFPSRTVYLAAVEGRLRGRDVGGDDRVPLRIRKITEDRPAVRVTSEVEGEGGVEEPARAAQVEDGPRAGGVVFFTRAGKCREDREDQ